MSDDALLKIAGAAAFILATFVVSFLRDISKSITDLNLSMAKILGELTMHEKALGDHSDRLETLEGRGKSRR